MVRSIAGAVLAGCAADDLLLVETSSPLCVVNDPDCVNPALQVPSCASYGCPCAPSSNPSQWAPRDTQLFYCRPS
jgi:hypothetical protein